MIKFTKYTGVVILGASILSLAACSSGHKAKAGQVAAAQGDDAAQSYALSQNKGYTGGIKRNKDGEVINPMTAPANQTYYFSFAGDALRPSDYQAMEVQANYLAQHPKAKIRLEGNADNRGSREYNVGLGWRRDQAVDRFFEQRGVQHKQIEMVSYGKERPAVFGDNEYAWRLNRRVSLVYEAY